LEEEAENIKGIEAVDVSPLSLNHIGQRFQPSLQEVDSPSPTVSLDPQAHHSPESDAPLSRSPDDGIR
jgi:hypothetical protein